VPTKQDRHAAILELIDDRAVASQEEMRRLLLQRGWDVTQSTLSRDVHELRLARVPTAEGGRYVRADGHGAGDEARPALETVVPQLLRTIDGVGELLLLRTLPGSAHTVALAMDSELPPDVIGTVAGDDTILVVCRSATARERLARRLRALVRTRAGRHGSGGERGQG
jgi:transcriptional regulator of arginine metabolism